METGTLGLLRVFPVVIMGPVQASVGHTASSEQRLINLTAQIVALLFWQRIATGLARIRPRESYFRSEQSPSYLPMEWHAARSGNAGDSCQIESPAPVLLLVASLRRALFLPNPEPAKANCLLPFSAGESLEKCVIGEGAKFFSAIVDIPQASGGKNSRFAFFVVQVFQTVKVGQGDAIAPVEVLQRVQELGFQLWVGAAARVGLRQWIGAFSFIDSHRCLLYR